MTGKPTPDIQALIAAAKRDGYDDQRHVNERAAAINKRKAEIEAEFGKLDQELQGLTTEYSSREAVRRAQLDAWSAALGESYDNGTDQAG